jgi:hypothetical protein
VEGRLRFVESRHEEQWSTQYLAAWRTKARQKPEGHQGQYELSVEEQYEEGQPLYGRLLNKTRSHLWFDDVLLSLVNKSNFLFESRDLAKECVAQRFTSRCLLSFVRRHTLKGQRQTTLRNLTRTIKSAIGSGWRKLVSKLESL